MTDLDCLRQLRASRSVAGFHATGFTGLDEAENLRRLRAVVADGLRPFNLAPALSGELNLAGTSYTAAEQVEVREACLELLVNLADLLGDEASRQQPLQAQSTATEALQIIEHAAALEPRQARPTADARDCCACSAIQQGRGLPLNGAGQLWIAPLRPTWQGTRSIAPAS